MTLHVSKARRRNTRGARAGKKIRSLYADLQVGDVYINGKRKTGGLTVFELAAARKSKKR